MSNATETKKILLREVVLLILAAVMVLAICIVAYQNSLLSRDMSALQQPLKNDIPHMGENLATLQKEVAAIKTTVTEIQTGFESLSGDLKNYLETGKKEWEQFRTMQEEISGLRTDFKDFLKDLRASRPSQPDE